jgi:hypothetical protein
METKIEVTLCEFQTQVKEIEGRAKGRRGRGTGAGPGEGAAKPPKFSGTKTWAVFRCQFETAAEHNYWTCQNKSTYLITALQGWATDMLHGVPKSTAYEETWRSTSETSTLPPRISQLKTRTQGVTESSQEFTTAIEQLAHSTYPTLPEDHIRREAGKAFTDRIEDPDIKVQLLLGGEKTVNEALRQVLKLQAVLLATRTHKKSARTFWRSR